MPRSQKPVPARCQPIGRGETVGAMRSAKGASTNAAVRDGDDTDLDSLLPFATEVGQGVAFDGGFAAGALRQDGGTTRFVVVTTNRYASAWRTIDLGQSHGDADAPRVFARGSKLGVGILEPSGATRTLRIGRVDRDSVQWGAEIQQGHDESLAFDIALGAVRGVAVWDDVPKKQKSSAIFLATVDPNSFDKPSKPVSVSPPTTDAEIPRVIERPGGFWMFWLARMPNARGSDGDSENRFQAEGIDHRWLEAVPLDEAGNLMGSPVQLGPKNGHVLGYDIAMLGDGSAVVVWRDDDTPSGSAGGQLYRVRLALGGVDAPELISDETSMMATPRVMPGWLAVADASGSTRLAPMGADGVLTDTLARETLLGAGEPIASIADDLLITRPDGTAAFLFVVRCGRAVLDSVDGGSADAVELDGDFAGELDGGGL